MKFSKSAAYSLSIIILLHALWFAGGMSWGHFYNGDSFEYIYLAENMKHGYYYGSNPVLPVNEYRVSLRTPAYSIWILVFYTLFGYNNWVILLAQNLLSIASCCLILNTFQHISPSRKYSWIYWLFIALYPAQMFFSDMVAPDILLQFFLMLYFRQLLLSLLAPGPKRIGWMSLWLVLATLTKPIVYPFLFLHFIFAIAYAIRSKRKILLLTGAIPLMVMAGYGFWNQQRTGLFHISSIQSINLLDYNVKQFLEYKHGREYADSFISIEDARVKALPGLKQKYEYASRKASEVVKANLWSYAIFHIRESARFFIEPGKSEMDLYTGWLTYHTLLRPTNFYSSLKEEGLAGAWRYLSEYPMLPVIILVLIFNVLRVIGWLLFLFSRSVPLPIRLLSAVFILYFALVTGPVANARYFLPVLPVISGCAFIGYGLLWENRKNRKQSFINR
jgi:hypothetical protein